MTSTSKINEQLKSKIRSLVKQVVVEQHTEPNKRMIKEMPGRLSLACPYCGDSTTDSSKKRGNLYWDTLQYHCFNCSQHGDVYSLLKDHHVNFKDREDSMKVIDYIQEHKVETNEVEVLEHDIFKTIFDLAPTRQELKESLGWVDIEPGDPAFFYLRGRMLSHRLENFMYSPKDRRIIVLNRAPHDKVIGLQTRALSKKRSARYLTYDIEKIYEEMGKELNVTEEELISLKKISTLFNVLMVDLQREVTMFEGPIDAMFINNSIGLATAGRSTDEFDEIPTIRYLFDNDETGKKKMMQKLKRGKKIFLWQKLFTETKLDDRYADFISSLPKSERYKYPKEIGDLNDLVIASFYLKDKSILKELNNYFSDSQLDAYFL
jgi:hypothetical protein